MPTEVNKQLSVSIFVFHQQEGEVILFMFLSLKQWTSQHATVPVENILHGNEWLYTAIISSHVILCNFILLQINILHYLVSVQRYNCECCLLAQWKQVQNGIRTIHDLYQNRKGNEQRRRKRLSGWFPGITVHTAATSEAWHQHHQGVHTVHTANRLSLKCLCKKTAVLHY